MKQGIKRMEELGFIDTTDKRFVEIVRQFTKYDHKGFIAEVINYFYFYNKKGVEVFTNNVKYGCGIRLDNRLIEAVLLNLNELEEELHLEEKGVGK